MTRRAELHAALDDLCREDVHRRATDEPGDEQVHRSPVELARHTDLLQQAVLQHRDPIAHRQRLDLVVGHVHGRDVRAAGCSELIWVAGLDAQLRVEVRQRLVHQEHLRVADDRAPHRHALALTAGQRLRLAGEAAPRGRAASRLRAPAVCAPPWGRPGSSVQSPCCRRPTCVGTARSSGTPSRRLGPSARRW